MSKEKKNFGCENLESSGPMSQTPFENHLNKCIALESKFYQTISGEKFQEDPTALRIQQKHNELLGVLGKKQIGEVRSILSDIEQLGTDASFLLKNHSAGIAFELFKACLAGFSDLEIQLQEPTSSLKKVFLFCLALVFLVGIVCLVLYFLGII